MLLDKGHIGKAPLTHDINNNAEKDDFSLYMKTSRTEQGDNGSDPYPLPNWVDTKLILEGREFVNRNFFAVFFAHFLSLVFLLSYTPVKITLLKTRESDTSLKSLKRYLSTLLHVRTWYEQDLLTPTGKGALDILKIRKIHNAIAKKFQTSGYSIEDEHNRKSDPVSREVQEDLKYGKTKGKPSTEIVENYIAYKNAPISKQIIVSQLDMVVTQYAFVGFVLMFPTAFGIWGKNQKGMEGFKHIWAILGHLMGIEDKYNFCIPNKVAERNGHMESLFYKVILPEMRFCNANNVVLWESLVQGWGLFIPFLRLRSVLLFAIKDVGQFKGETVAAAMSFNDQVCYAVMYYSFRWMRYQALVVFLNFLLRLAVYNSKFLYIRGYRSSTVRIIIDE